MNFDQLFHLEHELSLYTGAPYFDYGKPLSVGKCGAILLDDQQWYTR